MSSLRGDPVSDDAPWSAWTPQEAARRLHGVRARWYVVAGWAVELYLGKTTRHHEDLEIATPTLDFAGVRAALATLDFFVVGDGSRYPLDPTAMDLHFQTWGWDPSRSAYVIDVFRDPHDGDVWICRRDPSIRRPFSQIVRHDDEGIPYLAPEVVMLFKAKHCREKDEHDWSLVRPRLDHEQRVWLADALDVVHPGHRWASELRAEERAG
jgi:hypothetical protein